jgi:peptidyl-prolyl cis-trans isomerase C
MRCKLPSFWWRKVSFNLFHAEQAIWGLRSSTWNKLKFMGATGRNSRLTPRRHLLRNIRCAVILATLMAVGSVASAEVVGKSIATINGEAIFLNEFEGNWKAYLEQAQRTSSAPVTEAWLKDSKTALLDQMIEEKLLLQEANKRKIVVPKRQLEEGIQQVKNRFKSLPPGQRPSKEDFDRPLTPQENAEFVKELKGQELTEKEFEQKINDQLKVVRLTEEEIRGKVGIPFKDEKGGEGEPRELSPEYEKEAKTLFDKIESKFNDKNFKPNPENEVDQMVEVLKSRLGEAVKASHILVRSNKSDDPKKRQAALDKIKSLKKQIADGADFEELAKKNSDDSSARAGGDLGYFSRGQMVPEFEKAAFALPLGGVSDVVETPFGYHLIKVDEKRAARKLKFEDVKIDLAGYVYQKKMRDRFDQFVADLRKKADVKILIDLKKTDKG